jgi:hypothetical protein
MLIPCDACHRHIDIDEPRCPHCGALARPEQRERQGPTEDESVVEGCTPGVALENGPPPAPHDLPDDRAPVPAPVYGPPVAPAYGPPSFALRPRSWLVIALLVAFAVAVGIYLAR